MWTNKPVWLWLLEGLIENIKPVVNWICISILILAGAWNLFWGFCLASGGIALMGGLDFRLFFLAPLMDWQTGRQWLPLLEISCLLILLFLNVKFSIGWRQ